MEIIVIGSVIATVLFAIPLVVLRAGICRQERTRSLNRQPPGFSAAMARRVLGLYASKPVDDDQRDREPLHHPGLARDEGAAWPCQPVSAGRNYALTVRTRSATAINRGGDVHRAQSPNRPRRSALRMRCCHRRRLTDVPQVPQSGALDAPEGLAVPRHRL